MNQANTYSIILKALSPISHGDTLTCVNNTSNTRLFMRSLQYVNGLPIRIPSLSENSFRTSAIRKPLATHLLQSCKIEGGQLPKSVVNLLFSGGNLMGGAKAPNDEFTLAKQLRSAFPSLELLSGAVDDFVLPQGSLRLVIWPIAREYQDCLRYVADETITTEAAQVSIFDLVGEETRTRGTCDESEGNQMLYTYETMAAGTRFFAMFILSPHATELCRSALAFGLQQWDGFFGGQGRQGRGIMAMETLKLPSGDLYKDYIAANWIKLAEHLKNGTLGSNKVLCK